MIPFVPGLSAYSWLCFLLCLAIPATFNSSLTHVSLTHLLSQSPALTQSGHSVSVSRLVRPTKGNHTAT
jgi:hypothetical protein